MENGQFWLPEGAPWVSDYMAEITAFPGGEHDDFVDATVQALNYLRQLPEPGALAYLRKLAGNPGAALQDLFGFDNLCLESEEILSSIEAGSCRVCGESLFGKTQNIDALGKVCLVCARKRARASLI